MIYEMLKFYEESQWESIVENHFEYTKEETYSIVREIKHDLEVAASRA